MRRCPRCFSVYHERTARCEPCDAPTEPYSETRAEPPPRAPVPPTAGDATGDGDASEEAILAEADADWAERAVDALGLAGIAARMLLSEDEPPVVAVVVAAKDLERSIDVIGEALDEPPEPPRRASAPPGEEGAEAGPAPQDEAPEEFPETEAPASFPPRPLDPDQAALCPECGEAYRAGFERCADCGVPLVPADGPRGA